MWPEGNRCAVIISFDFDAETLWLSRDPKNVERPVALSQGIYGATIGVPRVLNLLQKHGINATFFIPGWVAEKYQDIVKEIQNKGHEIGHHGYLHEWPDSLEYEKEREVIGKGLEAIQKVTGRKPVGYRSPAWEFSPHTLKLLIEYGFLYSSNMMDKEIPYIHSYCNKLTKLVEIPVSWLLDDAPYFLYSVRIPHGRGIYNPQVVYENWKSEFDGFYKMGGCFVLTMHPQLIGRISRISMLEKLIRYIKQKKRVWFATCEEVARYWLEHGNML
jgi:peptidoglycan/xylan/chitin deacetylase (PgdA/CDA1 family)